MEMLKQTLEYVGLAIDVLGLAVILIGFVKALWAFARNELSRRTSEMAFWTRIRQLRCGLGTYLLLGLEFMIASDIIHSFLDPALESLMELGGIVLVRTVIAYFLGKEISELHEAE